jgi:rod shape-determining protein MreC
MANKRSGRTRLLLVSLLVTSLFLVTLDLRGVSLVVSFRNVTQSALAPFQAFASSILNPIGDFFGGFSDLRDSTSRIAELEKENEALKVKAIMNTDVAGELKQLKGVLDLAGKGRYKTVSARVISKGGTSTISESIVIDQGSQAGITRDMTVISENGLVGVVKSTTANTAVVMLLSDPAFRIGVRVAGTQFMGVLSGEGEGRYFVQMLSASGELKFEDSLLAIGSSGGKPFVPGVPVGKVISVENRVGQLTARGKVEPYVNFDALRIVSVVLKSAGGDPGDALVPQAPRPVPTVTVFVTPSPNE